MPRNKTPLRRTTGPSFNSDNSHHSLANNIVLCGSPFIYGEDVHYNHCSQCDQCQQVCSTKALSAEKADTKYRPLFSAGCLNSMSAQCQTCVEQCPQQALTIHDNQQPQLDSSRCDGCGLCRASCYIGAVTLRLVA